MILSFDIENDPGIVANFFLRIDQLRPHKCVITRLVILILFVILVLSNQVHRFFNVNNIAMR